MHKTSAVQNKTCQTLLMLFVLITRFETVESFPFQDSFSSTSAVVNISQEKNLKSLGFAERLHRRSMNDHETTTVTRSCTTISSVSKGGRSWKVAKVTKAASIKLMLSSRKTVWLVWQAHVNGSLVFMFGLKSTDQPGTYHFVRNVRKKLILSEPQPENNLPTTDSSYFKISSNEWRHVASGLFVTDNDKNEVFLRKRRDLGGKYVLEEQNKC